MNIAKSVLAITLCMSPLAAAAAWAPAAVQQPDTTRDREITAEIRKSIVSDKSLSTAAHNVKIQTQAGVVTLSGEVKSEDEKKAVLAKAEQVVGSMSKVADQLTVKP